MKQQYLQISHSFYALILLTSIPSVTSILSKYSSYNLQFQKLIQKCCVSDLSLYKLPIFLLEYVKVVVISILIKNWLNEYYKVM